MSCPWSIWGPLDQDLAAVGWQFRLGVDWQDEKVLQRIEILLMTQLLELQPLKEVEAISWFRGIQVEDRD